MVMMIFLQLEPIFVNLDTRSGQGQVKMVLEDKGMILMQNFSRNPMVSFVFLYMGSRTPKYRVWLHNVYFM